MYLARRTPRKRKVVAVSDVTQLETILEMFLLRVFQRNKLWRGEDRAFITFDLCWNAWGASAVPDCCDFSKTSANEIREAKRLLLSFILKALNLFKFGGGMRQHGTTLALCKRSGAFDFLEGFLILIFQHPQALPLQCLGLLDSDYPSLRKYICPFSAPAVSPVSFPVLSSLAPAPQGTHWRAGGKKQDRAGTNTESLGSCFEWGQRCGESMDDRDGRWNGSLFVIPYCTVLTSSFHPSVPWSAPSLPHMSMSPSLLQPSHIPFNCSDTAPETATFS